METLTGDLPVDVNTYCLDDGLPFLYQGTYPEGIEPMARVVAVGDVHGDALSLVVLAARSGRARYVVEAEGEGIAEALTDLPTSSPAPSTGD